MKSKILHFIRSLIPPPVVNLIELEERTFQATRLEHALFLFASMPKVQSTLELVAQALKEEKPTSLALIAEKIKARYPLGGLPSPAPEPSPPPARLHCITHKMGKTTVYLYKALDPIFSPDKEDATLFKNQEIAEAVKKIIPFDKAKVVPYPLET